LVRRANVIRYCSTRILLEMSNNPCAATNNVENFMYTPELHRQWLLTEQSHCSGAGTVTIARVHANTTTGFKLPWRMQKPEVTCKINQQASINSTDQFVGCIVHDHVQRLADGFGDPKSTGTGTLQRTFRQGTTPPLSLESAARYWQKDNLDENLHYFNAPTASGQVNTRHFLSLTLPESCAVYSLFEAYQLIWYIEIVAAMHSLFIGNGLQLWAFYQGLNPSATDSDKQRKQRIKKLLIPLPIPPTGEFSRFAWVYMRVGCQKLVVNTLKILKRILQYHMSANTIGLAHGFDEPVCCEPTIELVKDIMVLANTETEAFRKWKHPLVRCYVCDRLPILVDKPQPTTNISRVPLYRWHATGSLVIVCIAVSKPDGSFFRYTDRSPLTRFQLSLIEHLGEVIEDASDWELTDKMMAGLKVNGASLGHVRLYTKTLETPVHFVNPPNLCITGSRRPSVSAGLTFQNLRHCQLCFEWCADVPSGCRAHVWCVKARNMRYHDDICALADDFPTEIDR
jgi:hypothetical protein